MKVLVTGYNGQLGFDVVKRLELVGIECKGTTPDDFDLLNELEVKSYIHSYKPDTVIHCAAYTAVDKAEDERELCYNINVRGTRYIVEVCKEINSKLVYISTDYVFNGEKEQAYGVDDKPNPINYYGKSKYEGELAVQESLKRYFIIRTSWVFGLNGNNFVKTMLKIGNGSKGLKVVSDQIGSPTYTPDLSRLIVDMITTEAYGIYHATNKGYCSWFEFAEEIFRQAGIETQVSPINTIDYPTKANRPRNSKLLKDKLEANGFTMLPDWQDGLRRYLEELKNFQKES